jgi:hypothetical protein
LLIQVIECTSSSVFLCFSSLIKTKGHENAVQVSVAVSPLAFPNRLFAYHVHHVR